MNFIGSYVNDVRDALVASLLSGQHAILLGAPGWGKTSIARAAANEIGEPWSFVRFDPSTPVEAIAGSYDPAAMLDGRLERVVAGTPYEAGVKVAVLDEVFRANEPMFDRLLDVLDRWDVPEQERPIVWGTANFVVSNERTAALIDRFALWVWLRTAPLKTDALINAHYNGGVVKIGLIPTWAEIEKVRQMTPTPKSVTAISECIDELEVEALAEGIHLHPRRKVQMMHILFRVTAWTDGPDFDQCSPRAKRALQWCMPALDATQAATWHSIVASVQDKVLALIETVLAQHVRLFKEVAAIQDVSIRRNRMSELGIKLAEAQEVLAAGGDDHRLKQAVQLITDWFGTAARGGQIERETL